MNLHSQKKTPEQMVEAIFALDLDPIKFKLMDKKEGYGWSRAQADHYELEYKRFLALLARFPDEVIAPNTNVDKFWHGHILDTMKYAQDCQHVFGYFLHHFPYFGLRDEEDAANLANAAATMKRLYEQEFAAAQAGESAYCAKATSSYCAKAGDKAVATDDAAYCAKADVSYCAKASDQMSAKAEENSAYCAKADVSYCAKASDTAQAAPADAAYCAKASVSYCAKASDKAAAEESAYCAKSSVSYCAKASDRLAAAGQPSALPDIVTGKGRPKLEQLSAA